MKWLIAPPAPQEFIAQFHELPSPVLQLLWNRGVKDAESIGKFLEPDYERDVHDPFLFRDMGRATDRIAQAIERNEKIVIHGDYDADGISASTILFTTLRMLGANVLEVFLPHRERDGYGLNMRTVRQLAAEKTRVIITCDCGIANVEETRFAMARGIDVIITDHHQFKEELPPAFAILHPKIPGETYPDQTLSGGGVAFKLAQALLQTTHYPPATPEPARQSPDGSSRMADGRSDGGRGVLRTTHSDKAAFEKWLLDLVAISSIADMVPLHGETRVLVKYGLMVLNKTKRVGLQALLAAARKQQGPLDAHTVGFQIAPRLNAAGRMQHARTSFELLVSNTPEEAAQLAGVVNTYNSERQKVTATVLEEARAQIEREAQGDSAVLFAYNPEWPLGIMGLVANKLKDRYYRPMLVMAGRGDEVTGSGRSIPEVNIVAAMEQIPEYFKKFGGHPQACGFTLRHETVIPEFEAALSRITAERLSGCDLTPRLDVDTELRLEEADTTLLAHMRQLEPFGMGNPEPKFLVRGLEVVEATRVGANGAHGRLFARQQVSPRKLMGFGMGEEVGGLRPGDRIDAVVQVNAHLWNGAEEVQLTIVDFKTAV